MDVLLEEKISTACLLLVGISIGFIFSFAYLDYFSPAKNYFSPDTQPSAHIKTEELNNIFLSNISYNLSVVQHTGSMRPAISDTSILIMKQDFKESEIEVGDIIVYSTEKNSVAHRVVYITKDKNGKLYVTKGDNVAWEDTTKVRFKDIEYLIVGVIY